MVFNETSILPCMVRLRGAFLLPAKVKFEELGRVVPSVTSHLYIPALVGAAGCGIW